MSQADTVEPKLYITVEKSLLENTCVNLKTALEYVQEALVEHDNALGRTTSKNRRYAQMMESDIEKIQLSINEIKFSINPHDFSL